MLTPSTEDPNRKDELERKKKEPETFEPLGSGSNPDKCKIVNERKKNANTSSK